MTLRRFGHSWRDIDVYLCEIGAMTSKTAHKWSNIFIDEDLDAFTAEERGGTQTDSFWDRYPDLEIEANRFVVEQCSKRESSFTAEVLAKFIDVRFHEITGVSKTDATFVRSLNSCRLDLRRFGAKYTNNKSRPYFLGHEREAVVNHRQDFVSYFTRHQEHFYSLTDGDFPQWMKPTKSPCILICK